jgi:P-type E1-E2 ATPase
MVIAYRDLSEPEYKKWSQHLETAATAIDDRETKLAEVYTLIERQLSFLGITAIEDKLQEGVKETLNLLQEAGIKIWMLTGDKSETAIQIAIQSGLLKEGFFIHLCFYFPTLAS